MPRPAAVGRTLCLAALILTALAAAPAQKPAPPDAMALLRRVRVAYHGLERVRIEGVITIELHAAGGSDQSFDSPVRLVAAPNNRVHAETRNAMFGTQYISDGSVLTTYSEQYNQYTRHPLAALDTVVRLVPSAISRYFTIDANAGARILRDETVSVGGAPVPCTVVEVAYPQISTEQQVSPTVYWIDTARALVVRDSVSVTTNNQSGGSVRLVQVTRYSVLDLNPTLADTTFAFQPPSGATLVQQIGPQAPPPSDLEGKKAPDFSLADLAGKPVRLSTLKGRVVLLDFWATWCGPCRIEMPRVQKLHEDFRTKGLAVYGVNVGEEAVDVRPFLKKAGYTFPILLDRERDVMNRYQVTGIPTLVIVDRTGTVHSYFVGVRADSVLRNALADLGVK